MGIWKSILLFIYSTTIFYESAVFTQQSNILNNLQKEECLKIIAFIYFEKKNWNFKNNIFVCLQQKSVK